MRFLIGNIGVAVNEGSGRRSTYEVFLQLLYLLLVALQSAVVHGPALDGDLPRLQVHLLQLKAAVTSLNSTNSGFLANVLHISHRRKEP